MTKNLIYLIDFLYQIKILLLIMLKLFKISGFFQNFLNSRFFQLFFLTKLSNSRINQVFRKSGNPVFNVDSVCQMMCHQGFFFCFQLIDIFFLFNFFGQFSANFKGEVELQVMTNSLLYLHKTFIVAEGRVSLRFFYHKKTSRLFKILGFLTTCLKF